MPRKLPASRNGHVPATTQSHAEDFAFHFRPRNHSQAEALTLFSECDVLGLIGPAGSGKTVLALALAIGEIRRKQVERITVIRPCVEAADSPLGWLGGGLDEKLDPHYLGFVEALHRISFNFPARRIRRLAVSFLRGLTFTDEVVILDEAQNCTLRELRLVLSRLGEKAKLLVVGDPEQPDIPNSGLVEFFDRLDGCPGLECVNFTDSDIVRHPRMREWLRRLR